MTSLAINRTYSPAEWKAESRKRNLRTVGGFLRTVLTPPMFVLMFVALAYGASVITGNGAEFVATATEFVMAVF